MQAYLLVAAPFNGIYREALRNKLGNGLLFTDRYSPFRFITRVRDELSALFSFVFYDMVYFQGLASKCKIRTVRKAQQCYAYRYFALRLNDISIRVDNGDIESQHRKSIVRNAVFPIFAGISLCFFSVS